MKCASRRSLAPDGVGQLRAAIKFFLSTSLGREFFNELNCFGSSRRCRRRRRRR